MTRFFFWIVPNSTVLSNKYKGWPENELNGIPYALPVSLQILDTNGDGFEDLVVCFDKDDLLPLDPGNQYGVLLVDFRHGYFNSNSNDFYPANTRTFSGYGTSPTSLELCAESCTLTLGYWKTHSKYGPAPYDPGWSDYEDVLFFSSGKTFIQVLHQPPQGNPYYILAHQYIAAFLNVLNGSSPDIVHPDFSDILEVLTQAQLLFNAYSPTDDLKKVKNQFTGLAKILDDYNNGLIGPGHCRE